jgi:hypothetical protein
MRNLDCEDISHYVKPYYLKVNGIKLHLYHHALNKKLIIYGILDNIKIDLV